MTAKPITIVGGGLAGLTLGILLRRENIPVTIYEGGDYPRHRVCGEFLSGRGRDIALEILPTLTNARRATRVSFHTEYSAPIRFELKQPALCISRFELDAILAAEFLNAGGNLQTNQRFVADTKQEGQVRAAGRIRAESTARPLLGLKAHAQNAAIDSDLQMHFGRNHYVGACSLPNDRVNICGLFWPTDPPKNLSTHWPQLLANATDLKNPTWDHESFCSVAGLAPGSEQLDGFAIGDAAAMIPPLTGNGMSMAFESAALALAHLATFARSKTSWPEAEFSYRRAWRQTFSSRLRWARLIQSALFQPACQRTLALAARACPVLLNVFFARTR